MTLNTITHNSLPSLTEWLEKIKVPYLEEFRQEDMNKFHRLSILKDTLGVNYDKPIYLELKDLTEYSPKLQKIIKQRGEEICALKIIPNKKGFPKFRAFGHTLNHTIDKWFPKQNPNPKDYNKVEILKHNNDMLYSSNFLINDHGIWGEMIEGVHWQLTQGIHYNHPITFCSNDYKKWIYATDENNFEKIGNHARLVSLALNKLKTKNINKQKKLKKELHAKFTPQGYLKGYFEFFVWTPQKISFNDYNRISYEKLKDLKIDLENYNSDLKGINASGGKIKGIVKIIKQNDTKNFKKGEILVSKTLNLNYLPLMKKAKAIITEQGSVLSHITLITRELKKPCIVNVKDATKKLKNGMKIKIDADKGTINIL